VKLTTHPYQVPRSKNEWSYTPLPQYVKYSLRLPSDEIAVEIDRLMHYILYMIS